jgi:hypothetical protein
MEFKDYIDKSIEEMYETLFCKGLDQSTSTASTYTTTSLTIESLNEIIEKLKPEHAILLNSYVPNNNIFEMENFFPDKYYCKKLLIINPFYYQYKLKDILEKNGCNMKIYE